MSTNIVNFTISNPAISFLLHDCVKSPHNQIGFLFGEIQREVSDVTSDLQSNNECIEITVSITATIPVEDLFFSKDGTLNEEILDTILGEDKKDVVGWYSFTRNLDISPSIYQLFLAHQLCDYFSHVPRYLFLFFRITTNVVFDSNFTYTNKFVCTTGPDISTPVELHIRQLGESTYAYNAHKPVTTSCNAFDSVLNTIEWNSDDIVSSYEALQALISAKLLQQINLQVKLCPRSTMLEMNHGNQTLGDDYEDVSFSEEVEECRRNTCPGTPSDPPDCELREEKMDQSVDNSPDSNSVSPSPPQSGRLPNRAPSPGNVLRSTTVTSRNQSPSPLRNPRPTRSNGTASLDLSGVTKSRGNPRGGKSPSVGVHQARPARSTNQTLRSTTNRSSRPTPTSDQSPGRNSNQSTPSTAGSRRSSTPGTKSIGILSRDMSLNTSYDSTVRRDSGDSPVNSQTSNGSDSDVDKSRNSYQSQEY